MSLIKILAIVSLSAFLVFISWFVTYTLVLKSHTKLVTENFFLQTKVEELSEHLKVSNNKRFVCKDQIQDICTELYKNNSSYVKRSRIISSANCIDKILE